MTENIRIEHLLHFCREIQSYSKRTDKELALKKYKCDDLSSLLKFLLDDDKKTNISTSRISKKVSEPFEAFNMTLFELIEYVCARNGDDRCLANVRRYIITSSKNSDEASFIEQVITKTLKLGITAKTVNKVYGNNFIPEFNVQLSKSIENISLSHGEWFSISQKINGNRCVVYRGNPYSRQGRKWFGLGHITKALATVIDLNEYTIDGELVYSNPEHLSDNDAFLKGTGILNSNVDKTYIIYIIFDILPNDEFDKGESVASYKQRKSLLKELDKRIEQEELYDTIRVVRFFYEGTDQSEIEACLDLATNLDMEGIMINLDVPYKCKRHAGIIKAKKFYTMDLPIVAVNAGIGRLSNTLGSIDVALPIGDKTGIVSVGSGFSDDDRCVLWSVRQDIIGKIVEVKFKNITKDKDTGLPSLQFPIFVRFRNDKVEASID